MAATGYTRQSAADIAPGLPIQSADHNNEYNQIQSAFDNTIGHDHSASTSGVGAKIDLTTSVTGILPIVNGGSGATAVFTAGSILFSNGTAFTQDNANLFWNDATNRLGIGTTTPTTALQVAGTITGVTINATTGLQVAGVALAASNLSNGVTGSGAIVLTTSPTITSATLTSATINNAVAININNGAAGITGFAPLSVSNSNANNQIFTMGKAGGGVTLSWGYSSISYSGVFMYGIDIASTPDSSFTPSLLVIDPFNRRVAIGHAPPVATLDVAGSILGSTSITSSGTLDSHARLTVNLNSGTLTPQTASGFQNTVLIGAADTLSSRVVNDSFATNPAYVLRRANGTAASPSQLLNNDMIGSFSWAGYGSTGYISDNNPAAIRANAAENWTDSATGTDITFLTTKVGTTTLVERLRLNHNGSLRYIPVTVANLPPAPQAGSTLFVSDATATTFASVVAGGGGNQVPVYYDGTNWRIG